MISAPILSALLTLHVGTTAELDLGTIRPGQIVRIVATVRNEGSEPLQFRAPIPGGGCGYANRLGDPIPPGAVARIDMPIEIKRSFVGKVVRTYHVSANHDRFSFEPTFEINAERVTEQPSSPEF